VQIATELAGLVQEFRQWSWCCRQVRTVTEPSILPNPSKFSATKTLTTSDRCGEESNQNMSVDFKCAKKHAARRKAAK
jgi:hypothetical protein